MSATIHKAESGTEIPPDLPIAKLETVDLQRLQNGNSDETQRLLEASREYGVFYLDLRSVETHILPILDSIYELAQELFSLPLDEKSLYDVDKLSKIKCNG